MVTSSEGFAMSVTLNVMIPFLSSVFPCIVMLFVKEVHVNFYANVDLCTAHFLEPSGISNCLGKSMMMLP